MLTTMKGNFKRQVALFNPELYKDIPVVVIGVGGIGSGVLMGLAKMGVSNITVYDHDRVEPHNIPNQFYTNECIGSYKVEAAQRIAKQFSPDGIDITIHHKKADKDVLLPNGCLLIFAMDSLAARKELFMSPMMSEVNYLIDARMGGNVISIYNVDMHNDDDIASYTESVNLIPHKTACAAQAISYTILLSAGLVCSSVRNNLVGNGNPFNTILDAKNFMMQTETSIVNDLQPERSTSRV